MIPTIQAGTILIRDEWTSIAGALALQSVPYMANWSVLGGDSFALDDKIQEAGWTFFFMAEEVKAMFFGRTGVTKVRQALRRILAKVKQQKRRGTNQEC